MLGLVIEKVLGKPIADVYKQYSFNPLGLTHTVFPTSGALPCPYARGVTENLDDSVVDAADWSPSQSFSAGQLVSTLADMNIWAKATATGAQISPALQKQRLTWSRLRLTSGAGRDRGRAREFGRCRR
jgi:D-alanyl-D-alanine carboxypeptidase